MTVWVIACLTAAAIVIRPFRLPEAVWAVAAAVVLVCTGLLSVAGAARGIGRGLDVYLFLIGMMVLAELARMTGLFDWLAAIAAARARGSALGLFTLVYLVGVLVTVFLSNDATAVVLTPAVAAVARSARVARPLPYLLICAFVANAASFVLPISNPANLVLYASRMPTLGRWLWLYLLPSIASIAVTYAVLWFTQRGDLRQQIARDPPVPVLSHAGRAAAAGIVMTAVLLIAASALDWQLGAPTCAAGLFTLLVVSSVGRSQPWQPLRHVSWSVIPLVAGLFVVVEALDRTGVIGRIAGQLQQYAAISSRGTAVGSALVIGFGSNLVNNLPAGLIAGTAVHSGAIPESVRSALLIGVDLGPNLSVTGSLATLLWLAALRREGISIGAVEFLKLGAWVMPPALLAALGALLLLS